jgi:hypothetical protein
MCGLPQRGHVLKDNHVFRSVSKETDSLSNEIVTITVFKLMLNLS